MDAIKPFNDSRVSHCYAVLNGTKYRMKSLYRPSTISANSSTQTTFSETPLDSVMQLCFWY